MSGQPTSEGERSVPEPGDAGFGATLFLNQNAHVAVLDGTGHILQVNDAWNAFADANGLSPTFRFLGTDYLSVCRRAYEAEGPGSEGAREACDGISAVLAGERPRFSLIYPCHAPHEQRWFLMFVRPFPMVGGAAVSHIDVTALKLAGWVPDETYMADSRRGRRPGDPLPS